MLSTCCTVKFPRELSRGHLQIKLLDDVTGYGASAYQIDHRRDELQKTLAGTSCDAIFLLRFDQYPCGRLVLRRLSQAQVYGTKNTYRNDYSNTTYRRRHSTDRISPKVSGYSCSTCSGLSGLCKAYILGRLPRSALMHLAAAAHRHLNLETRLPNTPR